MTIGLSDKTASTKEGDLAHLVALGSREKPGRLEIFPNHSPPGALKITLNCNEFTCRCPQTGQPDWATIQVAYQPNQRVVESKSVKLYLEQFREAGIFHEHLAQVILDDFVEALAPLFCQVSVTFNVRGGIAIAATAKYPGEEAR